MIQILWDLNYILIVCYSLSGLQPRKRAGYLTYNRDDQILSAGQHVMSAKIMKPRRHGHISKNLKLATLF